MAVADVPSGLIFQDVEVQLTGEDGNVFSILGRCKRAIRRAHGEEAAKQWADMAMSQGSYDEVLLFCMETLDVS